MGEPHPCGTSILPHPSAASRAGSTGGDAELGILPSFPLFSPQIPDFHPSLSPPHTSRIPVLPSLRPTDSRFPSFPLFSPPILDFLPSLLLADPRSPSFPLFSPHIPNSRPSLSPPHPSRIPGRTEGAGSSRRPPGLRALCRGHRDRSRARFANPICTKASLRGLAGAGAGIPSGFTARLQRELQTH